MAHGGRAPRPRVHGVRGRDGHPRVFDPLYAYAPIGERASFEIPWNRGKNATLGSSLHARGMGPSMAVVGATTREVFEAYDVEHFLGAVAGGQVASGGAPVRGFHKMPSPTSRGGRAKARRVFRSRAGAAPFAPEPRP